MDTLPAQFNYADYLAIALVTVWTLFGFKKGMSGQIAFFLAGIAVVLSLYFGLVPGRNWLMQRFALPHEIARIVAVVVLVTIPLVAVLLIHSVAGYVVKVTFTAWVDRLCGAAAGCFTACVFVALVFVSLNVLPERIRPAAAGQASWIGRHILGAESAVTRAIGLKMNDTRGVIEQAREQRTSKREKWEQ